MRGCDRGHTRGGAARHCLLNPEQTALARYYKPGWRTATLCAPACLQVVLCPLRAAGSGVQQAFMAAAAAMGDDQLNFKLKVLLLQWAGAAHVPGAALFSAASKALGEAAAALRSAAPQGNREQQSWRQEQTHKMHASLNPENILRANARY